MITVPKDVLETKALEYLRRVEETGETLIVTSQDEPVLKVESIRHRAPLLDTFSDIHGKLRGSDEDVLSPETAEWEDA